MGDITSKGHTDLDDLVTKLLNRNVDTHIAALNGIAAADDKRVVPHLIEILMIHEIADNWNQFGFPEVLRNHSPPRYLELPEARWPGVRNVLQAVAEPEYDSDYAWVEWESWYSQQDIDPLEGFDEWKLQLYRKYLPPVGRLLDVEPREFDLQDIRWGNCDPSFLAACNEPDFAPGDAVSTNGRESEYEQYLEPTDTVFGFTVDDTAYAIPRWVLFPHELANITIEGKPLTLSFCTLCNAPICYDRNVNGRRLTFNNTGMLLEGNKIMFDEETECLWSQHRGVPIAGEYLNIESDVRLDVHPVTQTTWEEWRETHPESLALDIETGYDFDYRFYKDNIGFFRHYWDNENAIQPGLTTKEGQLPEKTNVYGVVADGKATVHVYPVEVIDEDTIETDEIDGRSVAILRSPTNDIAVYEAPSIPVERDGETLIDADGEYWNITHDALISETDDQELPRVAGRHGLFFAFRSQYEHIEIKPERVLS